MYVKKRSRKHSLYTSPERVLSQLSPIEYWAEEAIVPLHLVTDQGGSVAKNNFLCAYHNNVCSFYFINNEHAAEVRRGRRYFRHDKSVALYLRTVAHIIKKFKSIENEEPSYLRIVRLLRAWSRAYSKTEAPRLQHAEHADRASIVKRFKGVGEARIQLRKIAESYIFPKMQHTLIQMAKPKGIPPDYTLFYTFNEMRRLIKHGKKVSPRIIKERSQGYVYWVSNGTSRLLTGETTTALRNHVHQLHLRGSSEELIGKGVSPGITRGKVRVVRHTTNNISEQVRAFKKGSILVTEMTRPQLLTICHKAKGIITNEGGLLSHAAIISRELHIPCVVGVKVATKVLKNEDVVEIDGNKGIVKVVKRKL